MAELRVRFGMLLAAHRRRSGMSQEALAEAAEISVEMVSKIETGASGARFPVIERLAGALKVDPAEFFTTELPKGALQREPMNRIMVRLARLSDADLVWVNRLLDAALRPRTSKEKAPAPSNSIRAVKADVTRASKGQNTRK